METKLGRICIGCVLSDAGEDAKVMKSYGVFVTVLSLGIVCLFYTTPIGVIKMKSPATTAVVCNGNDIQFEPQR
jgi:hypothetical protein